MFFSKTSVKLITILFLFVLIYSMTINIHYTSSGDFTHNYTSYSYNISSNLNNTNIHICQNSSCYNITNFNYNYNNSEMKLFEKTFNTYFNMTKKSFDKMATKNIKIKSEIIYPESYITYIFTFICVMLFI